MQINNIATGYHDPAALGKWGEPLDPLLEAVLQTNESATVTVNPATATLADILAKYDVTDITPTEFSEMIQKLYEAEAITEAELQQLTAIRHDLDMSGVDPESSLDLLEFYAESIEKAQRRFEDHENGPPPSEQMGPRLRRLDWIEKFALIQSSPDAVGINAFV